MQLTPSQKWDKCLEIIRDNLSEQQYTSWFSPLTFLRLSDDNVLTISCPSNYFAEYLEDHFFSLLGKVLTHVFGPSIRLIYEYPIVADDPSTTVNVGSAHPSQAVKPETYAENPFDPQEQKPINPNLNPDYTFENYCISNSNKVAQSIGEAIANNPSIQTFNPLFVFGPCGVGKTHLIQAIGIRIKEHDPMARVLYVTARLFETQYTKFRNNINEFMYFYQSIDTLIIDDIQDLIGKEKTQNAFFHIFNHLRLNNRQIILSSDCCPSEMQGMETRLLSRFKSGMTVQLEKPDLELRREVLKQKALRDGLKLSEDVVEYLAQNVTESIRELEGVMVSLLAHATVLNKEITIDLAKRVLSNSVRLNKPTVNFESITRCVSDFYHITPEQIFARTRKREVSDARQMVMYLAKKHTKMPLKAIGTRLDRKHATVLYACRSIEERLPFEKKLSEEISSIEKALFN